MASAAGLVVTSTGTFLAFSLVDVWFRPVATMFGILLSFAWVMTLKVRECEDASGTAVPRAE